LHDLFSVASKIFSSKPQLTVCISMQVRMVIDSCVFDADHLPGEPAVGARPAREQSVRAQGALLQVSTAFFRIICDFAQKLVFSAIPLSPIPQHVRLN